MGPTDPAADTQGKPEGMEPYGVPGKRLVVPILLVVAVVGVLAVLYTLSSHGLEPVGASFTRLESGTLAANATALDTKDVHSRDRFLEAHLDRAKDDGTSREDIRLRVEAMRDTMVALTGRTADTYGVVWKDVPMVVAFTGFEADAPTGTDA